MSFDSIKTTNKLLLIIVLPLAFYILDVLSFIFIPLIFAIFIALLFTPLMRWLSKKKTPKWISLVLVVSLIGGGLFGTVKIIQLSGKQIDQQKGTLYRTLDKKVDTAMTHYADVLGVKKDLNQSSIKSLLKNQRITAAIFGNFGSTLSLVQTTVVSILMTLFFLILLLAGSMNLQKIMQELLFTGRTQSVKTFIAIERSISQFLKVKFFMSLATGICFGLIAYFFDISFPLFWGLFAFVINFVQMVGSVISVLAVSLLAFIEIESPGIFLAVILLFTGVQVVFGSILEPILMGKSFSINIIVVLIMLMFWGFLWGVPGLILSIPLTVLIKTIMNEFKSTQYLARMMV